MLKNLKLPMWFPSVVQNHPGQGDLSISRISCSYSRPSILVQLPSHSSKRILSSLEVLQRASEAWVVVLEALLCPRPLGISAAAQVETIQRSSSPSRSRGAMLAPATAFCGAANVSW
jgi:hypothetical protein